MRFASLLGMFDGIIDSISSFFTDFGNSIFWSGILKFIGVLLYSLSLALFYVIDFLAMFFRRIVGLDGGVKVDGDEIAGDIVLTLIQRQEIMNVFFALLIVAVFLLFVSTIVAIIKSEYNFDKGGNSKGPIFGRAIKALFYFLSVPTVCIFGVFMANSLLKVLDDATGGGGENTHLSSLIFAACTNSANRVANDDAFWDAYRRSPNVSGARDNKAFFISGGVKVTNNEIDKDDNEAREKIAYGINDAFRNETTFGSVVGGNYAKINEDGKTQSGHFTWSATGRMGKPTGVTGAQDGFKWHYGLTLSNVTNPNGTFSVYDLNLVWFYYDLFSYDHLISLLASFLILKSLFDLCMGVVKRIYEMIVLFCVSPPIVALMPLDEGAAYKNWTKAFVGKTLAAYGGVLAMNFFFMLVPVLQTINVFGDNGVMFGVINLSGLFNYFAQLIMIIAGAISLTSISSMISGIIGADDAVASGAEVSKGVVGGIASAARFGIGAGGLIAGGIKTTAKLGGAALNAGHKLGKDIKKIATDGKDKNINNVANTNQQISGMTSGTPTGGGGGPTGGGGPQAPNPSQGVGNATSGGTPPAGGGGGAPSGGGASSGGSSSAPAGSSGDEPLLGDRFNKAVGGALGTAARATGKYLEGATGGGGVARAGAQTGKVTGKMGKATGKATASVAKSAARSFSYMDKRSSFSTNAGHFAAGVGKSIATGATAVGMAVATGATAVGMGVRTAVRGAGAVARGGIAVVKNVALPAVKSVAKGVGKVGALFAGAMTGGESDKAIKSVKEAWSETDTAKRHAERNAVLDGDKQKMLKDEYSKELKALETKYGGNHNNENFTKEWKKLMKKYQGKGLKLK